MTTNLKYQSGDTILHIHGMGDDLILALETIEDFEAIILDQNGRDALRNYLDDLEMEE